MALTGIVEGRLTIDAEVKRTADNAHPAYDLVISVLITPRPNGHIIRYRSDAIRREKPSDQNICSGPVELFGFCAIERRDLEVASNSIVQNARKNAR